MWGGKYMGSRREAVKSLGSQKNYCSGLDCRQKKKPVCECCVLLCVLRRHAVTVALPLQRMPGLSVRLILFTQSAATQMSGELQRAAGVRHTHHCTINYEGVFICLFFREKFRPRIRESLSFDSLACTPKETLLRYHLHPPGVNEGACCPCRKC